MRCSGGRPRRALTVQRAAAGAQQGIDARGERQRRRRCRGLPRHRDDRREEARVSSPCQTVGSTMFSSDSASPLDGSSPRPIGRPSAPGPLRSDCGTAPNRLGRRPSFRCSRDERVAGVGPATDRSSRACREAGVMSIPPRRTGHHEQSDAAESLRPAGRTAVIPIWSI